MIQEWFGGVNLRQAVQGVFGAGSEGVQEVVQAPELPPEYSGTLCLVWVVRPYLKANPSYMPSCACMR